jgi:ribosomal protein S18 acetylase RimI-like enzyme
MSRFEQGISTTFGESGWRRLWLAVDNDGQIVGHIDIRSHPESNTTHRALLGMGVDRNSRNQGLGLSLLDEMFTFATSQTELEWIDLWVLSSNSAAKALYVKAGFELGGELPDMFRIDGVSQGYTLMTRRIDPNAA